MHRTRWSRTGGKFATTHPRRWPSDGAVTLLFPISSRPCRFSIVTHDHESGLVRVPSALPSHVDIHVGTISRTDVIGLAHHTVPLIGAELLELSGMAALGFPLLLVGRSPGVGLRTPVSTLEHEDVEFGAQLDFHLAPSVYQVISIDGEILLARSDRRLRWHL